MKYSTVSSDDGEIRILLLPFCLSRDEVSQISTIAKELNYRPIVATTTAFALSRVREEVGSRQSESVRIVGVVCDGRAKKVALGLFVLKARQLLKKMAGLKTRKILLARVSIDGGTRSKIGRAHV